MTTAIRKNKWKQALDVAVSGKILPELMPPHIDFLSLPPISAWEDNYILIDWEATEAVYQGGGMIFGGYISALADYAAGTAMLTVIEDEDIFVTGELSVEYLKPVKAGKVLIKAEATALNDQWFEVIVTFTNSKGELCSKSRVSQRIVNKG